MRRSRIFMSLRKKISAAAGIPQKRPEAIFRQPVARWITVATQFQSDLELLGAVHRCCTDVPDGVGGDLFRCSGSCLHAAQIQCRPSPPYSAAEATRDELVSV